MSAVFNWFIPGRRAAVCATTTYAALVDAWRAELEASGVALRRWYDLTEPDYEDGLAAIDRWREAFFGRSGEVAVPRDGEATLDYPTFHFKPRLWKGPLRVLCEARSGPAEPGAVIFDPLETESPLLRLSERREIDNADAPLLMGDVVEMPLWKFLAACGRTDYGNLPAYEDVLKFNPEGSYLLNTSLRDEGGSEPPLHDNLIAMRFQLFLGCYATSFYHDAPVFVSSSRAVTAPIDAAYAPPAPAEPGVPPPPPPAIHARGMLYAAVLFGAGYRWDYKGSTPAWHFFTNQWCRNSNGNVPRNLPSREGLANLPKDQPVTPGSVCSDTTLFLFNYMIRNHGKEGNSTWGKGSVSGSMREQGTRYYAIHDCFEKKPKADVAALAPELSAEQKRAYLDRALAEVKALIVMVSQETAFWCAPLAAGTQAPSWAQVAKKTREKIEPVIHEERLSKPLLPLLNRMAVKAVGDEELAALAALYRGIVEGARDFRERLDAMMAGAAWQAFAAEGKELIESDAMGARATLQALGSRGAPVGAVEEQLGRKLTYAVHVLRAKLRRNLSRLVAIDKRRDELADSKGGIKDMSGFLSPINTVTLSGHEWAIVRLRRHAALLDEGALPEAGFVAAFHPLSGAPYVEGHDLGGQCFVFEEGSSLDRFDGGGTHKYAQMGAAPLWWRKVDGNLFVIQPSGSTVHFCDPGLSRDKPLVAITRLKSETVLAERHLAAPRAFRPILVHPTSKPADPSLHPAYETARERLVSNGPAMYASRALPFPTLTEARGAFAEHAETEARLDDFDKVKPAPDVAPENPAAGPAEVTR